MKHLIIFCLSAFFVSTASAAVINWGTGEDQGSLMSPINPPEFLEAGSVAYLCVGDISSAQQAVSALLSGDWEASEEYGVIARKNVTSDEYGTYLDSTNNETSGVVDDIYVGEQSLYVVMIDESGKFFTVSSVQTGTINEVKFGAETVNWTIDSLDDLSGGWSVIAPELSSSCALFCLAIGFMIRRKRNVI